MLRLRVKGQDDLRRVAEALRRGPGTLRQELTKSFKDAGNEVLKRVQHNVETMPVRGRRKGGRPFRDRMPGTNIRRRIARVTELQVSTSAGDPKVQFVVRSERLGNARNLPFYFDSGKVFRHPIMGNRSAWAGQSGAPWFYDEIKKDIRVFEAKCDAAIDRTIQKIEGS